MNNIPSFRNLNHSNLLHQAELLHQKYESIAQYTGEHFNIFSILDLNNKEIIHSKFLAYLLNPKQEHGQKDLFLKLFLEYLKSKFEVHSKEIKALHLNTPEVSCNLEKYIGTISTDEQTGGRIDILLSDYCNTIVIENKIHALDQSNQLVRYKTAYPNSFLLYLTLSGEPASMHSVGSLIHEEDYFCLSYETDILYWINQCIKECSNQPFIRETLNQYANLIKSLTNQTTNDKMQSELIKLILTNKESMQDLLQASRSLTNKINQLLRQVYTHISSELTISKLNSTLQNIDSQLCIQVGSIEKEELDTYNVDCFKINILYDLNQIFFIEVFENPKLYQLDTGIWSGGPQDQILTDIIGEIQCVKYNYNQNTQEICEDICQNIVTTVQKLDSLEKKLSRFHQ